MMAGLRAQKARNKIASARASASRKKTVEKAAPAKAQAQAKTPGKAVTKAKSRPTAEHRPSDADVALKARLSALERERDTLKADLQRTEALLRQAEKTNAQVSDRIAWALDSLHNILEGKG